MPGQDTPLSQTAQVPVMKIQHLAAEARSLDVAELRDHVPSRRYTLVVSLLYSTQIQTQDQLVTMLIKRMRSISRQRSRSTLPVSNGSGPCKPSTRGR